MLSFGERLKKARENKGFTQAQVMKITGVSDKSLSRYENNASAPDPNTILDLAQLYGVSADYLLGNTASPSDELLEELRTNTGKRILFDMLDTATEQDIQQVIAIVEALQKSKGNG